MKHKIVAIIGLLAGCALLLYWGGEAPAWLLRLEVLTVTIVALAYGYTAFNPALPGWLRHDSVKGVALVYLGVGAMFVPLNFLASAFLIGCGARLVMKSAAPVLGVWGGRPLGSTREIVIRNLTPMEKAR
jgi:hypothetical protein